MHTHIFSNMETFASALRKPLTWFSIACCVTYAIFELIFPSVGKVGEVGLILITLIGLAFGFRNSALLTPTVLLGVSILVQTAGWGASFDAKEYGFEPDAAPRIDLLSKWFLFLFFALWVPRTSIGVPLIWTAAIAGFFLLPWINGLAIHELELALQNRRIDVGTMNAQHAAMLSGILLIGSISLFIRGVTVKDHRKLFIGLAFSIFLSSTALLYATQTRGVWLGVAVASFSLIVLYFFLSKKTNSNGLPPKLITSIIIAVVAIILLVAINSNLSNRINKESGSFMLALEGKVEEIPFDSTGIRLRSWYYAGSFIAQKPWFGWGPDGSKLIMQESSALPPALKPQFGHLHNTYLDIIAQFGIFGLILYIALLVWLMKRIITAFSENSISLSAFLFGVAFLIYWILINIFESYMLFSSGKYAFTIVCAGVTSLTLSPERASTHPKDSRNYET